MNLYSHRSHGAAALALAIAVITTVPAFAQAPTKTYRGCAVVDLTKILEQSKTAKAARTRLEAEFAPQEERLSRLRSARNDAERAWLNTKSTQPGTEDAAKRLTLEAVTQALRAEQDDFNRRLDKRKNEELGKVMDRLNALYRQLGERERYAKLYQTGEPDPVYDPEAEARTYECTAKTDVSDALMRELDADL
jgi:Skp family chaperone for outer membrane proteins